MGNRGLESQRIQHERSRTKSKVSSKESSRSRGSPRAARKHPAEGGAGQQVVALDERNLKRAVNRYGTMPKGARIGAYLESLRQSGMTPEPITEQGVESDATVDQSSSHTSESMDRSMVGKAHKANQMLRSNSSHGGFSSANTRHSPSNSLVKRVQQGSLERAYAGAPSNVVAQTPDFEFPPPPADLPPPSPRLSKKSAADKENLPERLERSSSKQANNPGYPMDNNSPMSPMSENRTLGSPAVGSLSSPGSTLDHDHHHQRNTNKSEDAIKPFQKEEKANKPEEVLESSAPPADMLVSELFESFKAKTSKAGKTFPAPAEVTTPSQAEEGIGIDFKANLRKVKKQAVDESAKEVSNQIDFKSNLKKKSEFSAHSKAEDHQQSPGLVDFKAKLRKSNVSSTPAKVDNRDEDSTLDFKARLRKVSDPKDSSKNNQSPTKDSLDADNKKAQDQKRGSISSATDDTNADDKRKSTGSISSLRKMWESNPKIDSPDTDKQTVKFEKRVWPPVPNTETEKPMVPVKPTVKPPAPTTKPPPPKEPMVKPPPKPAMAVKPNVCNIYAAPTVTTTRSKPPLASRPVAKPVAAAETTHSGSGSACSSSAEASDKEELLGISHKLETSIGKDYRISGDIYTFLKSDSSFRCSQNRFKQ